MMWAMGADGDLDMPIEQQLFEPLDASGSKLDLDFAMGFLESRGQRGEQERRWAEGAPDLQAAGLDPRCPLREDSLEMRHLLQDRCHSTQKEPPRLGQLDPPD